MKEIKINVENGVNELVVRQGDASAVHTGRNVNVDSVTIPAVAEFLSKENITTEIILDSVLSFSIDKRTMELRYGVTQRHPYQINSAIELNPDLERFGINSGNSYTTFELADFIKMNRHYFESKPVAMQLVSELKNFKAKVDKEVENSSNDRGNRRMLLNQVIDSNIPESFVLELPVFKGQPKARVVVEININDDFTCTLISPDLKEFILLESETLINQQLDLIKEIHPQLRIYQK
ncbi:hypothetical protein [Myroides odoratus]|uniref:Uncharacterized protein n=1 Tax=Myroides odoratus TaxID=256 RepID=A0A378RNH7_MYROD|nr:hypothetical protein [Myroides odoratus]QQU04012.1 hypothetical protein I6I89_01580 [Myroides odoratus]STZ28603.1 Uncharacterised protein [Myroides odoratus]